MTDMPQVQISNIIRISVLIKLSYGLPMSIFKTPKIFGIHHWQTETPLVQNFIRIGISALKNIRI